ncbi:MAG TPA: citrate/2-methylcitrate synthase [Candidatus Binatia bacterium]|nr:citrate/2-methylcitrate synthase [Candidatus Binatia bacterium]
MAKDHYLTAREVTVELGVSASTLYAYVSRGLIRSEPTDGKKRVRRYHREDVQRLKERKELRRNPAKLAEQALHWGVPVLESSITLIADGRLYYRGHDVLALAATRTVEEVAGLIWLGNPEADVTPLFAAANGKIPPRCLAVRQHLFDLPPTELFQAVLPVAAAEDVAACDLRPTAVAQTGARILRLLTLVAAGREESNSDIAHTLQAGWAPEDPAAAQFLRTALILCADHELHVSAFTARCVASAGSTPYAVVMAGLAALQGVKHGMYIEQVEPFLREVGTPERAQVVIANRLKRGEQLPGFGHRLYPEGDPRGGALLELMAKVYADSPATALAHAVIEQARRVIGESPTIDFALAVLASVLHLPSSAAPALFALGRTIGWIGHAIEQYQLDQLIRPRARYVGPVSPPTENLHRQGGTSTTRSWWDVYQSLFDGVVSHTD